ncbi:MAG: CPBP family intramembrane metalloprotease [Mesorhizobium sp.]|nr:MAG: CPBP family intramembrane metalloprotease [Mesorhizobium sp.]
MRLVLIFAGLLALYLVLDRSAWSLRSIRGEWGLIVGALTIVAAFIVEYIVARKVPREAALALGLGAPRSGATWFTVIGSVVLIALIPIYCAIAGLPLSLRDGWWWLAFGIFAQGGIAEETVFRGFLFRHLREGRTFWRAAAIAAVPFVFVHLAMFWTMEPILAAVSLGVALSLTFPLAAIFERAGNSIWPGAFLHAVIQGTIKLVVVPDESVTQLALVWLVVTAVVPWAVFLLPKSQAESLPRGNPGRAHGG